MTPTEARDLAVKLTASWPRDPGVDISTWIDELLPLDPGTAGTAIVRMRRDLERPPTIARFFVTYRALDTTGRGSTDRSCLACAGEGWVPAPDRVHADERRTSQVQPCRSCPAGRAARDTHRRILRANGHDLSPEEPAPPPPPIEQALFPVEET